MSTTTHSSEQPATSAGASPAAIARYIQTSVLAVLLAIAFWPILISLYGSWFDKTLYMEHGVLVVPAAVYMVWMKRDELARIPCKPTSWGLFFLLLGALSAILGIAAHWVWVGRMAFLVSLVGFLLALFGARMVKELSYPLFTLIFMIAPPSFVYERVTMSLQLLASRVGESCLELLGYSVVREGNILELVGTKMSIEEACSGLRSLLSISFMCTLYNYFFVSGNSMKAFILFMSVPIAILGNIFRIIASGVASQYNQNLLQGEWHEAFGYVSIIVAAIGCILVHLAVLKIQKKGRIA